MLCLPVCLPAWAAHDVFSCCACQHGRHTMCFHVVLASMGGTRCVFMLCLLAWAAHDAFSCCACQHERHTMCFHIVPASMGGTRCVLCWQAQHKTHRVPSMLAGTP